MSSLITRSVSRFLYKTAVLYDILWRGMTWKGMDWITSEHFDVWIGSQHNEPQIYNPLSFSSFPRKSSPTYFHVENGCTIARAGKDGRVEYSEMDFDWKMHLLANSLVFKA